MSHVLGLRHLYNQEVISNEMVSARTEILS